MSSRPTYTRLLAVVILFLIALYIHYQGLNVWSRLPTPFSSDVAHEYLPVDSETIHISLFMLGDSDIANEGSMTIKSAIMHSSRPLHFHIVCSPGELPALTRRLALVDRPAYPIRVSLYPVEDAILVARKERANLGGDWHLMSKVFIAELLPTSIDRVIQMDTDMAFVVDPLLLWKEFDHMSDTQIIAMPTMGPNSHMATVCSCVMLLKLSAMRPPTGNLLMASTLMQSQQALTAGAFADARREKIRVWERLEDWDEAKPQMNDQAVYFVLWSFRKQWFMSLPVRWDISLCRGFYGLRLGPWTGTDNPNGDEMSAEEQRKKEEAVNENPEEQRPIYPGILHFNCEGAKNVWDSARVNNGSEWGPLGTTVSQYKWIWLNRGDGSAKMTVETLPITATLDEILAQSDSEY